MEATTTMNQLQQSRLPGVDHQGLNTLLAQIKDAFFFNHNRFLTKG